MKKKIAFLVISAVIESVFGQNSDSLKIFLIKYQNVSFVTADSIFNFTRYISPSGKFYFKEGLADSTTLDSSVFYGSSGFISPPGNYQLLYENYPRSVDTIYSYLTIKKTDHYNHSFLRIADELIYSYILRQIGETNKTGLASNKIKVIYPCEGLNYCTLYHVFTISIFADSAKIFWRSGQSVDFNGIQLIHNDSCLLKKKDIENIMMKISKVKPNSEMVCRRPGNPWFLEYNEGTIYKRFIISNYCFQGQKNLKPVATLCYLILGTGNKYFGANCSVYP